MQKSADQASEDGKLDLGTLTNTLETTHTFTKNWANAGDDNLTWENIGVEEMKVTGTLYVGVMENGTLKNQADGAVMVKASEFFERGWGSWFVGDLTNYAFFQDKTINVGTEGEIVFNNLPLVQKNENDTTNQLVYVVAETKVAFTVNGKNYTQSFTPTFTADGGNLKISYQPEKLMVGDDEVADGFFTPSDVTLSLSNLSNKSSSSSSATNTIATTGLTITKNWVDNENEEGLRPASVDIVILQEKNDSQSGEESARAALFTSRQAPNQTTLSDIDNVVLEGNGHVKVVTLSQANNWSAEIENLPGLGFDDKGNLITYKYTVRELKEDWKQDGDPNVPMKDDLVDEANSKFNSYYTTFYDTEGETHTVTNTLTHMDITAVKKWKPGTLTGENAKVIFTLQSRVGNGEWTDVDGQQTIELDGTVDGKESEAWKARWTELPRTDSNGSTIEYRIKETLASDLIENEHVTIIYPEKGITGKITVTKEGGDGNGLAGVEFTLNSDSSTQMPVVGTTDVNGELTFAKLPLYDEQTGEPITYTLTESATPDGHIRLEQPIEVSFTAQEKPVDGIYWQTNDGKYLLHKVEYEVVNGQYFQVVHTGGSGFYWPGVLGAGAAAAGVLYLIRRKTKGHNTEQ